MFTKKIKDTFSLDLLNAVSGILGEAKHSDECGCTACEKEEKNELGSKLKRERESKEKKEPLGVKTEAIDPDLESELKATRQTPQSIAKWNVVRNGKTISSHSSKDAADVKAMKHPSNKVRAAEETTIDSHFDALNEKLSKSAPAGEWISDFEKSDAPQFKGKSKEKRQKMAIAAYYSKKNESVEQIDELSAKMLGNYHAMARGDEEEARGELKHNLKNKEDNKEFHAQAAERVRKRNIGLKLASKRMHQPYKEEVEQIDELSKGKLATYINKAEDSADDLERKAIKGDDKSWRKMHKRLDSTLKAKHKWINAKEEAEQIDELSKSTLGSYINKAAERASTQSLTAGLKIAKDEKSAANMKQAAKRQKGIAKAVTKLTKEEQDFIDALNADTLDEARGRPKKAGGKDFTIHPKTKEKLMHNNPEHMARLEKLQKHGVIAKPKTEANQHIITQLQRAKTSMRGGETVHFTHGDSHHILGTHAAKLLDKYAGLKPNEKETFQKKIGHSHENLKSEL